MAWNKPYNISGSIHIGARVDPWCDVLRTLLRTKDVGVIGHYTGAFSVCAWPPRALVFSSGFDLHDLYVLVSGEKATWRSFANHLEVALTLAAFPYALIVHDRIISQAGDETLG